MTTKPKREAEMETEIRALTKLSKNAEKARAFGAAVTARAKVGELRTRLGRMRAEREADAELDPVKRVQRLRRLATEAGSYVAASNLSKLEDKLVEAREAAARAAAGDGFEDMARRQPDTTRIRDLIGWQPRNDLDAVVSATIEHMRTHAEQ